MNNSDIDEYKITPFTPREQKLIQGLWYYCQSLSPFLVRSLTIMEDSNDYDFLFRSLNSKNAGLRTYSRSMFRLFPTRFARVTAF